MLSVQFRGVQSVIDAYTQRGVAAWSIWQGKQFMFKYEGDNEQEGLTQLDATLQMLAGSTNAIYTLKVYEDFKKGSKIKSNLPDDGSFNFRLNMEDQVITNSQYTRQNNNNELLSRLTAIEAKLNKEEEEEEEEAPNKLGFIGEILQHEQLGPIVSGLIGRMMNPQPAGLPAPQHRIAGVSTNQDTEINKAIEVLKANDPKLGEHLGKLATLATTNPNSFQFLLSTLDNM